MCEINPHNVVDLLLETYRTRQRIESPISGKELEVRDYIVSLLDSCKSGHVDVDIRNELISDEYLDSDTSETNDEEESCPYTEISTSATHVATRSEAAEQCNVDMEYKVRAVKFWRSGKKSNVNSKQCKINLKN
jgi:hypothetical protein